MKSWDVSEPEVCLACLLAQATMFVGYQYADGAEYEGFVCDRCFGSLMKLLKVRALAGKLNPRVLVIRVEDQIKGEVTLSHAL